MSAFADAVVPPTISVSLDGYVRAAAIFGSIKNVVPLQDISAEFEIQKEEDAGGKPMYSAHPICVRSPLTCQYCRLSLTCPNAIDAWSHSRHLLPCYTSWRRTSFCPRARSCSEKTCSARTCS